MNLLILKFTQIRHCERSEATQGLKRGTLDCFTAFAMTADFFHEVALSRTE